MAREPAQSKPTFLLQGILISLPVVVLAIIGLWALQQDRASVEQEARSQADSLATATLASFEEFLQQIEPHGEWWTPPANLDCFVIDSNNVLTLPSPLDWPPTPAPLPTDLAAVLKTNKAEQWLAAEAAFDERDWPSAAGLYLAFLDGRRLEEEPMADFNAGIADGRFRWLALFRRAIALEKSNQLDLAIEAYNDVLNGVTRGGHQQCVSEAGLALAPLAALKVLNLAGDDPARLPNEWRLNPLGLVVTLDAQPSPFDPELKTRLKEIGPALVADSQRRMTLDHLFSTWKRSERGRRRYTEAAATRDVESRWPDLFWVDGEFHWLAVAQQWPTNQSQVPNEARAFVAFPESVLAGKLVDSVQVQNRNRDFVVGVDIGGRTINAFGDSLRTADTTQPSTLSARAQSVQLPMIVRVSLADPPAYFAAQQRRQWLFTALLLAAAATCGFGYLSARRAFLRQIRLNEQKSNFVSSVSHELRAPIASVRLMAEGLERGKIQDPRKQTEYFQFIGQECRRLSSLIENVLDFSRIEQGRKQYEFEPTDLLALTRETVKLMEPYAAERNVKLCLETPNHQQSLSNDEPSSIPPTPSTLDHRPSTIELVADGRALQQALINLIDNAIKHSPKGETVTVSLECHQPEGGRRKTKIGSPKAEDSTTSIPLSPQRGEGSLPRLRERERVARERRVRDVGQRLIDAARGGAAHDSQPSTFRLHVQDHGPGIPPGEHERIFERFHRLGSELRRETPGVGIGLSIVKHIVEAHGGRVTVRSAPGHGSRFSIELPMKENHELR